MKKSVLLCAVLCYCCGQGLTLPTGYGCQTGSEIAAGACSLSDSCLSEHPLSQELEDCGESFAYNGPVVMPDYASQCYKNMDGFERCRERVSLSEEESRYLLINTVGSQAFSLDAGHFAMNVMWDYPDLQRALAVSNRSKRLRGYEVRVRLENDTVTECWCLLEPNVLNITLGLNLSMPYGLSPAMTIEVLTLPFDSMYVEDYYRKFQRRNWPTNCTDNVVSDSMSCPPSLQHAPRGVTVLSSQIGSSKELFVSWLSGAGGPLYYVYVIREHSNFSVVVNGTEEVNIIGLDPLENYSVQVQGYAQCSGTSSFLSSLTSGSDGGGGIGCGMLSGAVPAPPVPTTHNIVTTTATTTATTATTTTAAANEESTSPTQKNPLLLPPVLTVLLLLGFLVALSVLLSYLIWRHYHKPSTEGSAGDDMSKYTGYHPLPPKPCLADVLVLYSLKTPQTEKVLIEESLVAPIKQDYMVNSCNDHTDKTIMQWVEEQARHAHSILIVCNESLCSEWRGSQRGQLLNSLKTIIESSVALGKVSKFATVLLRSDSEEFIPDNLYVKGMPTFVINADSKVVDLRDIFAFLQRNSKM